MRRRALLTLAGAGFGSLTGCLSSPEGTNSPGESDTRSPTRSRTDSPTTTGSPTSTSPPVTASYLVRPGPIADGVAELRIQPAVYLAERDGEAVFCTDGAPLFDNRYDPTATPVPVPEGDCEGFALRTVDVAGLDDARSLGTVEAAGRFDGGHTLVVHDTTVVLDDGTTTTDVHDTDFRVLTEGSAPSGRYGFEVGVRDEGPAAERDTRWRWTVTVTRFDPVA